MALTKLFMLLIATMYCVKARKIPIQKLIIIKKLDYKIKAVKKDVKILKRLSFIKFRYEGDIV